MIAEKFPELQGLDPQQQLILAGELWRSATRPVAGTPELSEEAVRILEERLVAFEERPDSGISWAELRDSK